ncbi:MAG: outer membrane protein transport protein [Pseudomonadota bacterium]
MRLPVMRVGLSLAVTLASSAACASLGNAGSNFGLMPNDVATAQALSMFSNQPSAVYYNPAYLARDRKGALSAAFLFTEQELTAKGWKEPDEIVVDDVVEGDSNYNILLGFKTDLSKMLKDDRAIVLGFMLGAERTGLSLLSFNSAASQTAQSLKYGQQSLFLSLGAGLNVMPGFDVGASTRITLAADAKLTADAQVNGQTDFEGLQVAAKPSIQPILSGNLNWGDLLCPNDKYCWAKGLETAATWRYESDYSANVDANALVPNLISNLPLLISTIDSYQPETFSAGVQYNMYKLRLGASADYQLWSGLNDKFKTDTVKDQALLKFKDVVIPRAGFEYRLNKEFSVLGGVSYEQSPLESTESLDVNYVDNDKIVMGLGFSYLIEKALFLSQPVRLDFAYQYHLLKDRDFLLTTTRNAAAGDCNGRTTPAPDNKPIRCEGVTSGGDVHVVNAAVHLTF